jgi:hypothetical protein
MGSKWKPRQQLEDIKPRSRAARAMIEGGTGKGGPMRDRRERRLKEREDLRRIAQEDEQYEEFD